METVLVIGAARSGIAVSKLLLKNGYHVVLTDSNVIKEKTELESMGIEVFDGGHPDSLKEKNYGKDKSKESHYFRHYIGAGGNRLQ